MRNKTINAMLELGISANTMGFEYIADAMELMEKDKELRFHVCRLYDAIAVKYGVATSSRVERAIRHAFQSALTHAPLETTEKWLTNTGKQTNGSLLSIFYLRLKGGEADV